MISLDKLNLSNVEKSRFRALSAYMKQFTETSSEPYDRHHYRIWLRGGSFKDVESYDEAQRVWYSSRERPMTIEVMQPKVKRWAKGF